MISAYGQIDQRKKILEDKLRSSLPTATSQVEISFKAEMLMDRDASEGANVYGQGLRATFHLGDVFVDGTNAGHLQRNLDRFLSALFGRTDISPTKDEYGMYAATSASLRSLDLSRQVGAAIMDESGHIVAQGCNEVAKAFGGNYWDTEEPDYRDVRIGRDPNDILKRHILRDTIERLYNLFSDDVRTVGAASDLLDIFLSAERTETGAGVLAEASALDLTEYGRVVHAEMNALCEAARIGRRTADTTLFCTTFPCHGCSKHIIAAGIKRVVYIEPYPKSRTQELFSKEIEIEKESADRVSFAPFLGISPNIYQQIFEKGRRKDSSGNAQQWYRGSPRPLIDIIVASYLEVENAVVGGLMGTMSGEPS